MGTAGIIGNVLDQYRRGDLMENDLAPLRDKIWEYYSRQEAAVSELFMALMYNANEFVKSQTKFNADLLERAYKDAYPWTD
jgi:hypothetical protein